ncbi:MAG TPA: hypothetical protein VK934_13140, partial [Fimbriimonas sp.]|nr:hypothetical protein [Fimbriimonas sp.]
LKARKLAGDEGFIILFETSPRRVIQWNLGGWGNTVHAFQLNDSRFGNGVPDKIETGRWYDILIEQRADRVRGYLDGKLIEDVAIEATPDFTAVAGIDAKANELVLKIVNSAGVSRPIALDLKGVQSGALAKVTTLKGRSLNDENSFKSPRNVAPRASVVRLDGFTVSPYSLTILRIPRK